MTMKPPMMKPPKATTATTKPPTMTTLNPQKVTTTMISLRKNRPTNPPTLNGPPATTTINSQTSIKLLTTPMAPPYKLHLSIADLYIIAPVPPALQEV